MKQGEGRGVALWASDASFHLLAPVFSSIKYGDWKRWPLRTLTEILWILINRDPAVLSPQLHVDYLLTPLEGTRRQGDSGHQPRVGKNTSGSRCLWEVLNRLFFWNFPILCFISQHVKWVWKESLPPLVSKYPEIWAGSPSHSYEMFSSASQIHWFYIKEAWPECWLGIQ